MGHPGIRIKDLRTKKKLSQDQLAEKLGMNRVNVSHYERGIITNIPSETLIKIADILDTNTDYLLGRTNQENISFNPELTSKDERDIQKELQNMIQGLGSNSYAAFDGGNLDDMDQEDRELLIASLENSLRLAKRLSKEKFTPKKFRKE